LKKIPSGNPDWNILLLMRTVPQRDHSEGPGGVLGRWIGPWLEDEKYWQVFFFVYFIFKSTTLSPGRIRIRFLPRRDVTTWPRHQRTVFLKKG
jgi:hypothetical protein